MKNLFPVCSLLLATAACAVPLGTDIQDRGGAVLTHPTVHVAFWGPWTVSDTAPRLQRWDKLLNAPGDIWNRLTEYGVAHGTLDAQATVAGNDPVDGVSETDVQSEIVREIDAGLLPVPGPDRIYMIMLPPGVQTAFAVQHSFTGYHAASTYNGVPYTYAVINYAHDDVVWSHELYEAATDPFANTWAFPNGQEVGDACENQTETMDGATVQKVWSGAWGACL